MRKYIISLIIITIIIFNTGCSNENINSEKILYIPILGEEGVLKDGSFVNGVNLAVKELNEEYKDKGYSIKTDIIDDKREYEVGVAKAIELSSDTSVTAVMNVQDFDVSKITGKILSSEKKICFFPYGAYDSVFEGNNPYLFCGTVTFSDLGGRMADFAVDNEYKKIAIYHNGKQSQEELVTAFERRLLGSDTKVVDYVPSITSQNEFDAIYDRWKALGVDCIVISQYGYEKAFDVLSMIREKDKEIAIIGEPIFNALTVTESNKDIAENLVVPSTLILEEDDLNDFRKKYKEEFGKELDIWVMQGYDMVKMIVSTAIKLDTNDTEKIAEELHNESGYEAIGRHIAFTKGGAIITDISKLPMLICKDGKFERID